MRVANVTLVVLTVAAYLARPWSCLVALNLEERPPGYPYHSADPHGFGALGAVVIALAMMGPVLWLLLQHRPEGVAPAVPIGRSAAILFAIATPMLLQLAYLAMPLRSGWPVAAASVAWVAVVLALCLRRSPGSVSAHAAFDRHPFMAWVLVGAIGLGKVAMVALALG